MPIRLEQRERVAIVTLDDAERRNALTAPMVAEIVDTFDALEADTGVGAIIVTGAPPAFCSGADVGNLAAFGQDVGRDGTDVQGIYEGFLRVARCSLPSVTAVNGPAVGAGFNLALACDVRVAGPTARFDSRFLSIGLHPGGGHTWLLERAVGPQVAAALVLFGERLGGDRAAEVGLAWRCVPDAELLDAAVAIAARAAEAPRELAMRAKATLRQVAFQPTFDDAVATELERQVWSFRQGFLAERLAASRARKRQA
jgi:enoyl-CoA hydratase